MRRKMDLGPLPDLPPPVIVRPANGDHWVAACGGTETPFKTRSGKTLWYMWNTRTGEHAYLDMDNDIFLTTPEALAALGMC